MKVWILLTLALFGCVEPEPPAVAAEPDPQPQVEEPNYCPYVEMPLDDLQPEISVHPNDVDCTWTFKDACRDRMIWET